MKRKIILIDKAKCDGCGKCVSACAEGAIQLVDGKAELVSEVYCDGLGACIGECPQGAITIEERDAAAFDESAAKAHIEIKKGHVCPGLLSFGMKKKPIQSDTEGEYPSVLENWPVQLRLVPVEAPFWKNADLLVAADCTVLAYGDFHRKFLAGKKVVIACPKLDDYSTYIEKLSSIISYNDVKSVTVLHMEVPCCSGIVRMTQMALAESGRDIPFHKIKITISGEAEVEDE